MWSICCYDMIRIKKPFLIPCTRAEKNIAVFENISYPTLNGEKFNVSHHLSGKWFGTLSRILLSTKCINKWTHPKLSRRFSYRSSDSSFPDVSVNMYFYFVH